MFELKIIRGANRLYRGVVRLALRSVNARDQRALNKLNGNMQKADQMRDAAQRLKRQAQSLEAKANDTYAVEATQINATYHTLANHADYIPVIG